MRASGTPHGRFCNMPGWTTVAVFVVLLVLIVWQAATNFRLNNMLRTYRRLARGRSGETLEELLQRIAVQQEVDAAALKELQARLTDLGNAADGHLQRVGMLRYNAFNDTGGDQSFALALADAKGDGVLVNGLFHRSECRVYAKPLKAWKSTYSLSDEEEEAVRKAR